MNTRKTVWILAAAAATSAVFVAPTAMAGDRFSLVRAIPDDVFFCTAGRHNAERAFLDQYWAEVFDALKATGIGADLMEFLASKLGEEERTAVEQLKERAKQLLDGVDWTALGGGEAVFAERFGKVIKVGDNITMMPPDMVFLIQGTQGSAGKNYEGLLAILHGIAAEINKATAQEIFLVETASKAGAKIASLNFLKAVPDVPPLPLTVALRGDVIIIALGSPILDDTLGLLDGNSDKKSLAATSRFKRAFAKLPTPEDEMTFFDMQALLDSIRPFIKDVVSEAAPDAKDVYAPIPDDPKVEEFHTKAVEAYRANDYQKALEYTQKEFQVAEGNARAMYNLACFNTLVGNTEEGLSWLEKAVDHGFHAPNQIATDSDLKALRQNERFLAALAKAKEKAAAGEVQWGGQIEGLSKRLMDVPGIVDYIAEVNYTDKYSVHTEQVTALVPDAAKHPIYPVFGKRRSVTNFDRYLPVETVAFSVDAGFDLDELYQFAVDTIAELGSEGREILQKWEELQEQNGVNLRKEILGLIHGEVITATIEQPLGTAWVGMLKVNDEEAARVKIATALDFLTANMPKLTQQNPMLAMFAMRTEPCTHEKLDGFQNIAFGIQPPFVCGIRDGYLILGTTADAVALCLATAAGEHPSIKENKEVMAEAVRPKGTFRSISFADKRNTGKDLAELVGAVSLAGGLAGAMIPDAENRQLLMKVLGMVAKLRPVFQKLDFYKSTSKCCSFDGKAWYSRSVTNYRPPPKRATAEGI